MRVSSVAIQKKTKARLFKLGEKVIIVFVHNSEGYDPISREMDEKRCQEILHRFYKNKTELEGGICEAKIVKLIGEDGYEIKILKIFYQMEKDNLFLYKEGTTQGFHECWLKLGNWFLKTYPSFLNKEFNPSKRENFAYPQVINKVNHVKSRSRTGRVVV